MDTALWLPLLFLVGLALIGMILLFVEACDNV
jgi:hypothetical protein